ncbi:MAG: GAF domain-containing protein [Candidatus Eremiobacteraeota bacterium]|nr:GAF domain-containing protein [Candidatus Eremiobacteraeota bacterium]
MDQNSQEEQKLLVQDIIARINSIKNYYRVFDEYVVSVAESLNAERGFIMLKMKGTEDMKVFGTHNLNPESIATTADISQSVINDVAEKGKAIVSVDAMKDPRFQDKTSVVISGLRSILCVPLKIKGITVGILYLDNRYKGSAFRDQHLEVLTSFLDAASPVMEALYSRLEASEKIKDKRIDKRVVPKKRSGI